MQRCVDKLNGRQERLLRLYSRYEGNPWEPDWLYDAPPVAQRFYRASRTGFAEMIVKAPLHRLRVTSILTAASSSEIGDKVAWGVWRAAGMLSEATDIHRDALIAGDAYAIVGVDDDGPFVSSEDPRQVVTIHDPVRQSRVRAAVKMFTDGDVGVDYVYLYRPGVRYVAKSSDFIGPRQMANGEVVRMPFDARTWVWDEDHGGADGESWPDGLEDFVGVVRFRNDEGVGVFERHEDLLYRLDHVILQGMVVATMQAFKQRAIKVDPADMPDVDPDTGALIDYDGMFEADPGVLWKLPATAELWESGQVDLTGILQMAEKEMQRLSAVTFTPLSMFNSDAVNQSASGADLVKEGLTDKVSALHDRFEQPHAQVASALLRLAGEGERADVNSIRIGWAPAARYGLTEKGQAATSGKASGVPWQTIMSEFWQFGPEKIAQMQTQRHDDELLFGETLTATPQPEPESGVVAGV